MNPLRKFEENPGFDNPDNHGDLWAAVNRCYTRIAVIDERIRVAIVFGLPFVGLVVALQLTLLGLVVGHMVLG